MCCVFPQLLFVVFGSVVVGGDAVVVGHAFGMVSLVLQTSPGCEHDDGLLQPSDGGSGVAESIFERYM